MSRRFKAPSRKSHRSLRASCDRWKRTRRREIEKRKPRKQRFGRSHGLAPENRSGNFPAAEKWHGHFHDSALILSADSARRLACRNGTAHRIEFGTQAHGSTHPPKVLLPVGLCVPLPDVQAIDRARLSLLRSTSAILAVAALQGTEENRSMEEGLPRHSEKWHTRKQNRSQLNPLRRG